MHYRASRRQTLVRGEVAHKKQLPIGNGEYIEGTVVPYRSGSEHWNEYLLDDGTVVRVKLVATEMIRLDGQYDQEGNPAYVVQSTNVTHVSAPDNLKAKGDQS